MTLTLFRKSIGAAAVPALLALMILATNLGVPQCQRVAVFAAVDNLFDRRYHEFRGFPNRGIYARSGVKYHLFGD